MVPKGDGAAPPNGVVALLLLRIGCDGAAVAKGFALLALPAVAPVAEGRELG